MAILKKQNSVNPYEDRVGLVYARVSTKRQELDGSGLQSQEGRCISELQRIGVSHEKSFLDSYTGGGDFMKRPGMREMLEYIDAHPHKKFVVVFDDLKRFARDTEFHIKLRTTLKARDVLPSCLNYKFDDSPEGMFVETILSAGNELERHQNRRQVIQKQKARLQLGYWPFRSLRPYKMEKDSMHGNILKLQYPEALWVKEAAEGFANGTFVRKIDACKFLVEKGYWENQSPEKYIDKLTVLLCNVLLAGYVENPDWEIKPLLGHHEALISLETHEAIKKRIKKEGLGKRIRLDISPDFPVRGLTLCFCCKAPLTAGWSKGRKVKYPLYKCQKKGCRYYGKSIRKKDIEDRFNILLQKQGIRSEVGIVVEKVFEDVWNEEVANTKESEIIQQKKKGALKEKIEQLSEVAASTQSSTVRNVYEKQIEEIANKLEEFEQDTHNHTDFAIPYRTALNKAKQFLKSPYAVWVNLDVRDQHALFYFVFEEKLPYDMQYGYRTEEIPSGVRLFEEFASSETRDVELAEIESACKEEYIVLLRV